MSLSEKKLEFRTYKICYKEEDVREFIKNLKEDILFLGNNSDFNPVWLLERIDKLTGEDLI